MLWVGGEEVGDKTVTFQWEEPERAAGMGLVQRRPMPWKGWQNDSEVCCTLVFYPCHACHSISCVVRRQHAGDIGGGYPETSVRFIYSHHLQE